MTSVLGVVREGKLVQEETWKKLIVTLAPDFGDETITFAESGCNSSADDGAGEVTTVIGVVETSF